MNRKLISVILIGALISIFIIFITVANAECSSIFCSKNQTMVVTLKDNADINMSKKIISNTKKIKIIKITDRNKEWSRMVNRMDLPKMDNPFKNEFIIKIKRNANIDEINTTLKKLDFVEDVKPFSDTNTTEK